MQNIGVTELLIILVIVILIFGASRLPQLARSIGQSVKEFKQAKDEDKSKDGQEKP